MDKQDEVVYSLYKPFRNQIRSYNLIDSLYVIWGYARNFTFNHPFPQDIERPNEFSSFGDISERRHKGITEHEQELLLREFIINCDTKPTKDSLKQRHKLAKLINYLRFKFNEGIQRHYSEKSDILIELNRIMHRQFKWQFGYSKKILFRYYKVFNDDDVNSIIKRKLKLSSYDMFVLGTYFLGITAKHFQIKLPLTSEAPFLNNEMIDIFFENFSISIEQARQELKDCQQMNENYLYSYNPLLAKPILRYNDTFLCPIPLLIFWQMTSGLYYSIIGESGFENAYGNSFQKYIGEVLSKCCNNNNLTVLAEEKYNKDEKYSVPQN